jgi:hypothetical protein
MNWSRRFQAADVKMLPANYVLKGDLFDDLNPMPAWYWLVAGNLLALVPLGAAIVLLWLPYQFYTALGAPLALFPEFALPTWGQWILGFIIVVASMLLHELLHGAALLMMGHGAHLSYDSGYLYATVNRGEFLTRRHYLMMVLTPVTVMTFGGGVLLLFLPVTLAQLVLIALLLNAAASVGDFFVAQRVWRCPADALFADEKGIKVYISVQKAENMEEGELHAR